MCNNIRIVQRIWASGKVDFAVEKYENDEWNIIMWETRQNNCIHTYSAEFDDLDKALDFRQRYFVDHDKILNIKVIDDKY